MVFLFHSLLIRYVDRFIILAFRVSHLNNAWREVTARYCGVSPDGKNGCSEVEIGPLLQAEKVEQTKMSLCNLMFFQRFYIQNVTLQTCYCIEDNCNLDEKCTCDTDTSENSGNCDTSGNSENSENSEVSIVTFSFITLVVAWLLIEFGCSLALDREKACKKPNLAQTARH